MFQVIFVIAALAVSQIQSGLIGAPLTTGVIASRSLIATPSAAIVGPGASSIVSPGLGFVGAPLSAGLIGAPVHTSRLVASPFSASLVDGPAHLTTRIISSW